MQNNNMSIEPKDGDVYLRGMNALKMHRFNEAFVLFNQGATSDVRCLVERGLAYLNARGVQKNIDLGVADLLEAREKGSGDASFHLSTLADIGMGMEQDYAKGLSLTRESAERGSALGMLKWSAVLLRKGTTLYNPQEGIEYVKRSADMGFAPALNTYGVMLVSGQHIPRDPVLAKTYFERSSTELPEAMYNLAMTYHDGCAGERDEVKCLELMTKSALSGYTKAMVGVGLRHLNGQGTERNPRKAKDWFAKAAGQGDAEGQNLYGTTFLMGIGASPDPATARVWFEKAAASGHAGGLNNYGVCLLNGVGGERNPEKAADCFDKAKESGNADAFFNLGMCYMTGNGVVRNAYQAYALLLDASNRGHKLAPVHVAWCLTKGIGVASDTPEGIRRLKKMVAEKDALALFFLGLAHMDGVGVEKNTETALTYIREASERGIQPAKDYLKDYEKRNSNGDSVDAKLAKEAEAEGNWEKAFSHWYKAAEGGDVTAMCMLADMLSKGRGVAQSDELACVWLERASSKESIVADTMLAEFLWEGKGTQKNVKRALKLLRQGALLGYGPACEHLAEHLRTGSSEEKPDLAGYAEWARKGAEAGHKPCCAQLAEAYKKGWGVDKSREWADHWLKKSK